MSKDLKILISAGLNLGKSVGEINKDIKALQKSINKLDLKIQIDNKALQQIKKLNEQIIKANKQLNESLSKGTEQVANVQNAKFRQQGRIPLGEPEQDIKRTEARYGDLQKRVNEIKENAKDLSRISVQTGQDINNVTQATITYTDKLNRSVTETYRLYDKLGEDGKLLNIPDSQGNLQAQKEWVLDSQKIVDNVGKQNKELKKLALERAKIRRELTGMRADGRISDSQFEDLSSRLTSVKDTQSLNRYKESMRNLVSETNKATISQSNLNQAQVKFRDNLQQLYSQGKITEQQLRQFGNAIDTTKSIGQLKQLERRLEQVKVKASTAMSELLSPFDTEMALRKFDEKIINATRQFPSIDRQELSRLQQEFHNLATTTGLTRQQVQHYNQSLSETVTRTKQVTANTNTMAGAFQNAMIKFPIKFHPCGNKTSLTAGNPLEPYIPQRNLKR